MNKNSLGKLFNPQSIAIVGASDKPGKVGNVITENILKLGFGGEIFLVNPSHNELFEKKCYASLMEIENKVDLAIVVVPAKFVNKIIEGAKDKVKNFVVISAGFSETDKEGKEREDELLKLAEKNNLNILGPNCLGFIVPQIKLNVSFAGGMPKKGNISLISQSGALAVAIMDIAEKEHFGFSHIISVGNKMQLDEGSLIEYLGNDTQTKVIAIYMEGIKDGRRFVEVAQKVSEKKPIIVLKAGRSEKAQKAIASHTGALAGSDKVMDAAFKKSGVLRADNLEEFFSLIKFISNFRENKTGKTAIITNAGGPGVLTTDNFREKRARLVEFSNDIKNELREFLPQEASVENPVDLLGDADEIRYQKALDILLKSGEVENVICLLTAQDQTPVEKVAQVIIKYSQKTNKNVIPVFIGGKKIEKGLKILNEAGIPNFSFPKNTVDALDKTIKVGRKDDNWVKKDGLNSEIVGEIKKIISFTKNKGKKALTFSDAGKIMEKCHIPVVDFTVLKFSGGRIGLLDKINYSGVFPVVLKVDSDKVLHKTDKQALILNIENKKELKRAVKKIRENFPTESLIVQPMLKSDTELILGMKKDSVFGPILVFGLGGIYTEVFKMVDFIILPTSKNEIKEILLNGKMSFLFKETRGKVTLNIEKMIDLIYNFSLLIDALPEIKEIDINPLLVYDKEAIAVDVKIMI